MKLRDKIAVVTGAGRGIGRAICARYIEEGAFVFVTDIDEAKAGASQLNWVSMPPPCDWMLPARSRSTA
jgi:NAD(P)-dependent dehydrogenase (short-subunit alcohol dehydrogenase family)